MSRIKIKSGRWKDTTHFLEKEKAAAWAKAAHLQFPDQKIRVKYDRRGRMYRVQLWLPPPERHATKTTAEKRKGKGTNHG